MKNYFVDAEKIGAMLHPEIEDSNKNQALEADIRVDDLIEESRKFGLNLRDFQSDNVYKFR